MNQWLRGSAQWRADNPDFDPEYQGERAAASVQQYGVNWTWRATQQYLEGEIVGILPDGEQLKLSAMYMFYNPATERVQYKQVGRGGWFAEADDPVRKYPLDFGLPPSGSTRCSTRRRARSR